MSKIRLFGTSSGYVEIAPAAAAGNNTLTAPSTVGEIIAKDAAGAIGITSMKASNVNVGAAVTITESGIEASGIGITVANINGAQVGGRRNMIINGDQRIAQRNSTAKLVTTSAAYRCVDRFKTDIDGTSIGDFFHAQTGTGTTISADVPTGQGFSYSSKVTVNTSVSQPTAATDKHQLYTMLEQQDVAHLEWGTSSAKTCTLSFHVKSSVAGTYPLWFGIYGLSGGSTYYYWTNYTINSANTWEKKVITVTGPTSGGALSGTSDVGLRIEWTLGVGSDSETGTLNEWTTSSTLRAASGSVYLPENAGATWLMTGAQFELGSQATAFEFRSFGEELALCQRYYYKSTQYSYPVQNPIAVGQQVDGDGYLGWAFYNSTSCRSFNYEHPVEMRASPTVNFYSSARVSSPDDGKMAVYSGAWYNLTSNTAETNTRRLGIKGGYTPGLTTGNTYLIGGGFECGAEL